VILDHLLGKLLHLIVLRVLEGELAPVDVDLIRGQGDVGDLVVVHRRRGE